MATNLDRVHLSIMSMIIMLSHAHVSHAIKSRWLRGAPPELWRNLQRLPWLFLLLLLRLLHVPLQDASAGEVRFHSWCVAALYQSRARRRRRLCMWIGLFLHTGHMHVQVSKKKLLACLYTCAFIIINCASNLKRIYYPHANNMHLTFQALNKNHSDESAKSALCECCWCHACNRIVCATTPHVHLWFCQEVCIQEYVYLRFDW